jgi:YNFM family putative membrane transporter
VFLCGSLAFLDLYCTQPLLPLLAVVFHASEAAVSLTISAATLGVAFSAFLLAVFAERTPRKRTIVLSMTALAVSALLTTLATSLPVLAILRLLQGLVTPGVFIITIAYITEEWPPHLIPRVMSFYVAGTVFGGFLGRTLGGLLAGPFGWRAVFLVLGTLGLCGAALTQRLLPEGIHQRSQIGSNSYLKPILDNLQNPRLVATFIVGFCMLFTLVSVFSYITFYLAAAPFHLSTQQLSWLFGVYLVGLIATIAAGTTLIRTGLRFGMLAAIALCIVGIAITLFHSIPLVAVGLATTASGVFIAQTCANSFLRDAAAANSRVSAAGMYICSYYIGGTVGGVLPGLLWKFGGWPTCAALTCFFLLLAASVTFFGWRHRPAQLDPVPV